ncbi:MAG: hypothetical protein ACP5M0_10135 [Desulfomonilaceae bacterium]
MLPVGSKCIAVILVSLMAIAIFCPLGHAQSALRGFGATVSSVDSGDQDAEAEDDFDLESCQRFCLGSPAGSNRSAGPILADCLRDCNDRYWKAYDRRMKKLGN